MTNTNHSYRPNRNVLHDSPSQSGKSLVVFNDDNLSDAPSVPLLSADTSQSISQPNILWALLGALLPLVGMIILVTVGKGGNEGDFRGKMKWFTFGMVGAIAVVIIGYIAFLLISGATIDDVIQI